MPKTERWQWYVEESAPTEQHHHAIDRVYFAGRSQFQQVAVIGTPVFGSNTRINPPHAKPPASRAGHIEVIFPIAHFQPHRYLFSLWLGDHYSDYCSVEKALQIEFRHDVPPPLPLQYIGSLRLPVRWDYRAAVDNSPSQQHTRMARH